MAFADFSQNRPSISLLQRSLEAGRLGHGYLFSGSALDELEAVARTLAKTVNCQNPPRRSGKTSMPLDSCDQCASCRRIDANNHADVLWVRPESKSRIITIDQVRDLLHAVHLKPNDADYKVAVVAGVDRLNEQAANSFLKTLEEPPPRSLMILLTTDPQRILETILSRCLRLSFSGEGTPGRSPDAAWIATFSAVAAESAKGLLARYRLLGTLLEQLGERKSSIEKSLGEKSPLEKYGDAEAKLKDKWEDELAAAVEAEYRRQRGDILLSLQWWLRDVWLKSLALGDELLAFPEFAPAAGVIGGRISSQEAMENLGVIEETQRLLGSNVQEALALEVGLLKLKL